jgi:hypothetical protein
MSDQHLPEQKDLESRARAAFDASVESLDGRTRSKLTRARHAAMEELHRSARRPWQRASVALGGLSAAVLAVWVGIGQFTPVTPSEIVLDDIELVADAPSLELLNEVEFYAWVARERADGSVEPGQVSDGSG